MKKYLIVFGIIAIITTGCGKKLSLEEKEIENIAKDVAAASVNNDADGKKISMAKLYEKTRYLITDTQYKVSDSEDILKNTYKLDTTGKTICSVVKYRYRGVDKTVGYCK